MTGQTTHKNNFAPSSQNISANQNISSQSPYLVQEFLPIYLFIHLFILLIFNQNCCCFSENKKDL